MRAFIVSAGLAVLTGLATVPASATLVTNGGFGSVTGSLTGWETNGFLIGAVGTTPAFSPGNPQAFMRGVNSSGVPFTLQQAIATTPGQTYTVSLRLTNQLLSSTATMGQNLFQARFGSAVPFLSFDDVSAFGSTLFSFNLQGGSDTSTFITFTAFSESNRSLWLIDDVTITPFNPGGGGGPGDGVNPGVPEPSSWAMLIAGFGLVGAASRRRRAAIA